MRIIIVLIWLASILSCSQEAKPVIHLEYTDRQLEIFAPDIVSTFLYERDIAIHPSGDEIIYTLGNQKQTQRGLVSISKKDNLWSDPEVLNISGKFQDIEPFYSNNGSRLFFASNRPLKGETDEGDYNLWYSDRSENGWDTPLPMGNHINTEGNEYYPSISSNGNLYFTASREDGIGREDIFISEYIGGIYQSPVVLDKNINSQYFEFNAFIHPDEDLIIYSSYGRSDDLGGGDLYFSIKKADGSWSPSIHMGNEINSPQLDYCPFIDVQNSLVYFTSERYDNDLGSLSVERIRLAAQRSKNGFGDIYRIPIEATMIEEE